tara:strand:+ start:1051 stop:1296 length:246 start_codon:yes stop_codon:yes gene_type:complete
LTDKINIENKITAENKIPIKYFNGYPPRKHNSITIENSIALVEKFAGRIKEIVKKTGIHNGKIDCEKVINLSLIFDKYLAT